MRKIDEIYRKKYGEDYSSDFNKRILISDVSDYKIITSKQSYDTIDSAINMDFAVDKIIKGIYIGCTKGIFIVFTDKTYCHIMSNENGFYLYDDSCEDFSFLGEYGVPTKLCSLLEIDKDVVIQIYKELMAAAAKNSEEYEYKHYLELDKNMPTEKTGNNLTETFDSTRSFYIKGYDRFDDPVFVARGGGWTHHLTDAECFKTEEEAITFWKSKGYDDIEIEIYYC